MYVCVCVCEYAYHLHSQLYFLTHSCDDCPQQCLRQRRLRSLLTLWLYGETRARCPFADNLHEFAIIVDGISMDVIASGDTMIATTLSPLATKPPTKTKQNKRRTQENTNNKKSVRRCKSGGLQQHTTSSHANM